MTRLALHLVPLVALLMFSNGTGAEPAPPGLLLPILTPTTEEHKAWAARAQDCAAQAGRLVHDLIMVAQDDRRSRDDRRLAITFIGEVGTRRALEFLVANFSLRLPLVVEVGDGDRMRRWPCQYAIQKSRDWNAVPLLLGRLKGKTRLDDWDVMAVARLIDTICGPRTARAIVEAELAQMKEPPGAVENLKRALLFLPKQ